MSIASEITRLQGVKSDILQAISDKGVTVPAGSALADCPGLISDIPSGTNTDVADGYKKLNYIEYNGGALDIPAFASNTSNYKGDFRDTERLSVYVPNLSMSSSQDMSFISRKCKSVPASRYLLYFFGGSNIISAAIYGSYNGYNHQYDFDSVGTNFGLGNFVEVYFSNMNNSAINSQTNSGGPVGIYDQFLVDGVWGCSFISEYIGTKFFNYELIDYSTRTTKIYLVPAKRVSDNKLGVFDTISQTFFPEKNSSLNAGPEIR